jgi:simple sugar transport system substrate-binding protein
MKKVIIILVAVCIIATMAFVGVGCKTTTTTTTTAAAEITAAAETAKAAAETTAAATGTKNPADFQIVYIVKADGIPWFDVERMGLEQAAKDYGFKSQTVGPAKADAALQAQMVEDYIAKGVQAIAVCPNDPAAIEPVFAKANAAGIQTYGHEGSTFKNVSFDIEGMSNKIFGETIMKRMIEFTGGKGGYVASVGLLTSVSHNEWVDAEIAYQKANAPDFVNLLGYSAGSDRFEEKEDQTIAHDKILEFIKTYPTLSGIIGSPMTTGPAAGLAIEEKGLKGKVRFVGTGLPITIGNYLTADIVQEGLFWDPYQVGYALGYTAFQTWLGTPPKDGGAILKPDGTAIPGYEKIGIQANKDGGNIMFGQGLIELTKANLAEWNQKFADYGWKQQ